MLNKSGLYAHEGIPPADSQQLARLALARRYQLQACAAHLLPGEMALRGCQKWVAFGKKEVTLCAYPALGKGKIKGLQSCASPWMCPVCAAKISCRRCDQELSPALAEAKAKGWHVLMVTWTIQHEQRDKLEALIAGLTVARKQSRGGRAWMRLRARYGIMGSIRALEVTHGKNGWHPHFHELLFLEHAVDRLMLLADLRHQWAEGVAKAALRGVNGHGVRVSDTYKDVEQYVAKFGRDPKWGVAQEMSRQNVKQAKKASGGLSPFQLLAVACDNDFVEGAPAPYTAANLFREYCAAMKGSRQLYWSPGLKAALGVADLSDAQVEALNEEDVHRQDFGTLSAPEWNCLRTDGQHVKLHSLLCEGDKPGVDALIAPYVGVRTDRPVVSSVGLVVDDPFADDRDRHPVVGQWHDPLAAQFAQTPERGEGIARRLREKWARGEHVLHFAEQQEAADDRRASIPAVLRAGSPLGPLVKPALSRWGVAGYHRLLMLTSWLAGDVEWQEEALPVWRQEGLGV